MNIVVYTALLVVLAWSAKISAGPSRQIPCDFTQYRNKKDGKCILCDKCNVGEQVTQNCGHDRSGNLVGEKCKPCGPETYQAHPSTARCHDCKKKCTGGRRMTRPCNKTSDMVCSCMRGWYEENGTCQRCSYCCADNYKRSHYYNQKCGNDRMGKCSCRRHDSCKIKQCPAVTLASSPSTPWPTPTLNASTQKIVSTTTVLQPNGSMEASGTATGITLITPWWILAIVTFAIAFIIIILVVIVWHCRKCVNDGLPSRDNNHSLPSTVHRQCPPVWIHESEIENNAKLMEPPSGSCSETPDKEIVCSCSLESGQHANILENSSTRIVKSLGEVSNKDDSTSGEDSEVEPLLENTTEQKKVETSAISVVAQTAASTSKMAAGCEIQMGVANGANNGNATCIEQDDDIQVDDKMQGGSPIPETKDPPRDFQMDAQCSCQVIACSTQKIEWENCQRTRAPSDQEVHKKCPNRGWKNQEGHSCPECEPRRSYSLSHVLGRQCLREELCHELNQNSVWKTILIYIREEKRIKTLEGKNDPAHGTLDTLRKLRPDITLAAFCDILIGVKRADLEQVITQHHVKCSLCKKNPFD